MEKIKVILPIFLAVFLCLSVSAGHVQAKEAYAECYSVSLYNEGSSNIALDGSGDSDIIVSPGEAVIAVIYFGYIAPTSSELKDKAEIVVAFDYTPLCCLIEDIEAAECLGGHDYVRILEITAPTEPGLYYINYGHSEGCSCQHAKLLWNLAHEIGTIEVVGENNDEDEVWTCIYEKLHSLNLSEDTQNLEQYDGAYSIVFFQRGSEIEVDVSTTGYWIESGSLSISVSEDRDIEYDTEYVSGIYRSKPYEYESLGYDRIGEFEDDTVGFLANVVFGLIPFAGYPANVKNYLEKIGALKYDTEIYDVDNHTSHLDKDIIRYFFESNIHRNDRDIVVIPWFVKGIGTQVNTVRIDCPKIGVDHYGEYTFIYRLDFGIYTYHVTHDIALPIWLPSIREQKDSSVTKEI